MLLLPIESFIAKLPLLPVADTRPASDFRRGHLPGAGHFPRSSWSQAAAVFRPHSSVLLYGEREFSASVLAAAPLEWLVLEGGYAAFLQWRERVLSQARNLFVIAGKTGSGKTQLLQQLKEAGEQIIDLEALARHRGSVFGATFSKPQPVREQFLNRLALEWHYLDPQRITFVEWEADYLGELQLPKILVQAIHTAPGLRLEIPRKKRIENILEMYSRVNDAEMMKAILKLTRRLGSGKVDRLLQLLHENHRAEIVDDLLDYYDAGKHYQLPDHLPTVGQLPEQYQRIKALVVPFLS